MEKDASERRGPSLRFVLGCVVAAALAAALVYVGGQVLHVIDPPSTYETALLCTVSDAVDADGVLLFEETLVPGGGSLGYLAADGERVSTGTVVAEVYSDPSQSALRAQLTSLRSQIALLEKSQNTSSTQIDLLLKERTAALYDLMEALDHGQYEAAPAGREAYLLAQNKLRVTTGEVGDFRAEIAALQAQADALEAQLGAPAQITSPVTGYFIGAQSTRQRTVSTEEILALDAAGLDALLQQGADAPLTGCAGKVVSSFTWYYCGVCPAQQAKKLLGADGGPLRRTVELRFPGQVEESLEARLTEVEIDEESGLARFVVRCDSINGDVLKLGQAQAQIVVGTYTGLRVRASAIHYVREEDGASADGQDGGQGENYVPGVYIKYGSLARFCRIDPVDEEHPLVTDGDYVVIPVKGTAGSVSEVRLYDEVVVSGQNLYDGKLL